MRLTQLDGVRAIAIGAVMIEHFGGRGLNSLIPVGAGSAGVALFFVLSGFLITSILLNDFDHSTESRGRIWYNFYMRRALRLIPAYYAWLLVLVLMDVQPIADSWPWHAAYLTNVWIALGNPENVFWSLAVEEQFYLFWPFVIVFVPRRVLPHAIILTTIGGSLLFKFAAARAGIDSNTIQTLLLSNMTELGIGALFATVCYRGGKPYQFDWYTPAVHRVFSGAALGSVAIAVGAWMLWGTGGAYRYYLNDFVCAIAFIWLIVNASIGFGGLFGWFLEHPAVQYVGRISYGLYLTHNFMPDILERWVVLPKWQAGPIVLAMTFGVCTLSWYLLEQPVLRLKSRFEARKPRETREEPAGNGTTETAPATAR
jgi:peptidoglycan/LPS O-acetylase OafA/YrhL